MKNFHTYSLAYILLVLCISCTGSQDHEKSKPNVILFLIDDFGYADIGFEGNTQIKTPGIDRIAAHGVRFTNFYQSGAACAPTRASLLTGRYHLETGVWGVHAGRDYIHRDETTLADVLGANGYATGAFGKWHSGKTWRYFSWNRGFDVGVHSRLYQYYGTQVIFNNKLINVEGPITDVIGEQVIQFIHENKDRPFFAYVPFQAIHEPYNCPPDVFQRYKEAGYTDHVARLYGMIEVMDANIGRILDTVHNLGLDERTVIMFLSDDGPSPGFDLTYQGRRMNDEEKAERTRGWAREYRGGKGSIWQGGSITPFYMRWDGTIESGQDYGQLSGVIDLFPTILDLCEIQYEGELLPLHGRSLWPVIMGRTPEDWQERRYFDNTNFYLRQRQEIRLDNPQMHHIALHYKNYKLIRGNNALYGGADSVYYELYDLEQDPMESTNIVREKAEMSAQLISEIENWYAGVLNNGRAFHQPVYEIGNWEEPNSPINIDGFRDLWGSLLETSQVGFRLTNWTIPYSGVNFDVDVKERGVYRVELGYACGENDLGAEFRIFTEYDTATLVIEAAGSAFSEELNLPAGPQTLNVELIKMGNGSVAMESLSRLTIQRLPEAGDKGVLRGSGMIIKNEGVEKKVWHSSATADFLYGAKDDKPLEALPGTPISLMPFADNLDQVESVTLFLGFDKIETRIGPPYEFSIETDIPGRHTLNLEFRTKSGTVTSVHGDILVLKD